MLERFKNTEKLLLQLRTLVDNITFDELTMGVPTPETEKGWKEVQMDLDARDRRKAVSVTRILAGRHQRGDVVLENLLGKKFPEGFSLECMRRIVKDIKPHQEPGLPFGSTF